MWSTYGHHEYQFCRETCCSNAEMVCNAVWSLFLAICELTRKFRLGMQIGIQNSTLPFNVTAIN